VCSSDLRKRRRTAQWPTLRAIKTEQVADYIEQHLSKAY